MFFPSNINFFSFHLAGGGWSSTSNGWSFIARGGCFAPDFFKATKWRSNLLVAVERLAISFLNVRLASNVQQAFSIHALVLLVLHEVESCRTLWRSNQPTLCFFLRRRSCCHRGGLWIAMTFLIPLLFDVWIAGAAEYCQRLSEFLRGHRKLEDFLPSHRSCCAVLSQVLIFPGKFSKLSIGVPKKQWGARKGEKRTHYSMNVTVRIGILWYFEAGNLPMVQEIRRCMFCDTFFRPFSGEPMFGLVWVK